MTDHGIHWRAAEIEPDRDMSFRVVVSTETRGRDRLVVRSDGWQLDDYRRNPVVLFNHDKNAIVGHAPDIEVQRRRLVARVQLAEAGTSDVVDMVRALVRQGLLRGASAGFMALEAPEFKMVAGEIEEIVIKRQALMEFSLTPLPAVPDALALARSIGASSETIARIFPGAGVAAQHARIRAELGLITCRVRHPC